LKSSTLEKHSFGKAILCKSPTLENLPFGKDPLWKSVKGDFLFFAVR
jgi:hypothetical protein